MDPRKQPQDEHKGSPPCPMCSYPLEEHAKGYYCKVCRSKRTPEPDSIRKTAKLFTEVTADEFIAGQTVHYVGLNDRTYCARFVNDDMPHLEVYGPFKVYKPIMMETGARTFFVNLSREIE